VHEAPALKRRVGERPHQARAAAAVDQHVAAAGDLGAHRVRRREVRGGRAPARAAEDRDPQVERWG